MTNPNPVQRTCVACGADVKAFELKCAFCGHQFADARGSESVRQLVERLDALNASDDKDAAVRKVELIRNWPIPVTAADLLEFAAWAGSNALVGSGQSTPLTDAWRAKALEAIAKGKTAFRETDRGWESMRDLERRLTSDQRTRMTVAAGKGLLRTGVIVVAVIAALFLALLYAVMQM